MRGILIGLLLSSCGLAALSPASAQGLDPNFFHRMSTQFRGSDMSLDVARKRIYVTGSGTASVLEQRDADHYEHIAEVPTAYRAKSSIFVPQLKRLYVADSGKGKPEAKLALQIFEIQ